MDGERWPIFLILVLKNRPLGQPFVYMVSPTASAHVQTTFLSDNSLLVLSLVAIAAIHALPGVSPGIARCLY